jgi:hypothetical protein
VNVKLNADGIEKKRQNFSSAAVQDTERERERERERRRNLEKRRLRK